MPLENKTDQIALYGSLLTELRNANAEMERGAFRILKQAADEEPIDVTAEAIRTNRISIVLLETALKMQGLQ